MGYQHPLELCFWRVSVKMTFVVAVWGLVWLAQLLRWTSMSCTNSAVFPSAMLSHLPPNGIVCRWQHQCGEGGSTVVPDWARCRTLSDTTVSDGATEKDRMMEPLSKQNVPEPLYKKVPRVIEIERNTERSEVCTRPRVNSLLLWHNCDVVKKSLHMTRLVHSLFGFCVNINGDRPVLER